MTLGLRSPEAEAESTVEEDKVVIVEWCPNGWVVKRRRTRVKQTDRRKQQEARGTNEPNVFQDVVDVVPLSTKVSPKQLFSGLTGVFISRIPAVMLDVLHDWQGRFLSVCLCLCRCVVCVDVVFVDVCECGRGVLWCGVLWSGVVLWVVWVCVVLCCLGFYCVGCCCVLLCCVVLCGVMWLLCGVVLNRARTEKTTLKKKSRRESVTQRRQIHVHGQRPPPPPTTARHHHTTPHHTTPHHTTPHHTTPHHTTPHHTTPHHTTPHHTTPHHTTPHHTTPHHPSAPFQRQISNKDTQLVAPRMEH